MAKFQEGDWVGVGADMGQVLKVTPKRIRVDWGDRESLVDPAKARKVAPHNFMVTSDKKGLFSQGRYTAECTCGWVSYTFSFKSGAVRAHTAHRRAPG